MDSPEGIRVKLTVLHPHDDGTSAVTYRGEDGWGGLVRQHYYNPDTFSQTFS
jgi:hypothetical protein